MPIYEYLCDKCGHEFEREQRITDEPVRTCPKCRARKVRRLISRTSFVLKGGGWYKDLYSSSSSSGKSEGEGAATSEGSGDASSSESAKKSKKPASEKKSKSKTKAKGTKAAA